MHKLLIDISAHGFGHLGQTAPIVAALRREPPDLDIVIRTGLPEEAVAQRIARPFRFVPSGDGFGLAMRSPFTVDRAASYRRYAELHRDYDAHIDALAAWIGKEGFDGVLSNISYPVLAAARRVGTPALAVSSLNWLDMFRHYCGGFDNGAEIARQIKLSYESAAAFCRLIPGTPMPGLATTPIRDVIAAAGVSHAQSLRERFGLKADARIVLFALGGMRVDRPPKWDRQLANDHLVFAPSAWARDGAWRPVEASGLTFPDLIASADVVVTKPGYGIIAEVAAAGIPALLLARENWPEEPHLAGWLSRSGRCAYLGARLDALRLEEVLSACARLAAEPAPARPPIGGERHVAAMMRRLTEQHV